jgi:predicted transcriptional regulator
MSDAADERGMVLFGLGRLESAVMAVLWDAGQPLPVRDVLDRLQTPRPLAYTTVMTVLDNLHRKHWVLRHRAGRAYLYQTAMSREEAAAQVLRTLLDSTDDPEAVLLHFLRSASERESAALRKALGGGAEQP